MTKTFNKIKVGIGLAALATLFAFNLHHAVVYHYGVLNLNFSQHPQVYAQTNSAGDPKCSCGKWSAGVWICRGKCDGGGSPTPPNLVQYRVPCTGYYKEYIYNWQGVRTGYLTRRGDCCKRLEHEAAWCNHDMLPLCVD